jgi:protein-disulfide isomerase
MIPGVLAALALASALGADDVVARVGGRAITAAELQAAAARRLIEVETRAYEQKRAALLELIDGELLRQEAARRGVSVDALLAAEVEARTVAVREWDADAYRASHAKELAALDETAARAEAARRLREERLAQRRFGFLNELRTRIPIAVQLEAPRIAVDPGDAAARGPATAPVTIIEFGEFQCPYCLRVQPTLRQIEARYRDRVRLVYRHYPLARHQNAGKAAEAVECAREQDRFWPLHDRLFEHTDRLAVADLKAHARAVGVEGAKFDACLDSGRHAARVRRDLAEVESYGSLGTPLFFINGRLVSGAQPAGVFIRVIDEELARAAGGGTGSTP